MMLSLCRMELLRLKKSVSAWVIAVLVILLGVFDVIFTIKLEKSDINICNIITSDFASRITLLLLGVLLAGYIAGEYKDGFIKSIAGQIPHKGMLALSKIVMTVIVTSIIFLLYFASITITSLFFSKDVVVNFGFEPRHVILWFTIFIIHISISGMFILIAELTRSSSWVIGVTLFICFDMTSLLYALINILIEKIGIKSVDISVFMLDANLSQMELGVSDKCIIRSLVIGILFLILMALTGMKTQKVKDI